MRGRLRIRGLSVALLMLGAFGLGLILGGPRLDAVLGATGTPGVGTPAAAATERAERAEREELQRLRTQVAASPVVCAPIPTLTPAPTATSVPPVASGTSLPYTGAWMVTVGEASTATTIAVQTAVGLFLRIELTVVNGSADARPFPVRDLTLLDESGRSYDVDLGASLLADSTLQAQVPPSLPTDGVVVFDVAEDVGQRFILQSRTDPTFRVSVELAQRG